MRNYEKPVVVRNDELSEGIYLASGDATCWSTSASSEQDWNGSHHVFEVRATHGGDVVHISTAVTVAMTFSSGVTDAYTESDWSCSASGNSVTVTRTSHANAYNSGDSVTFKVWVKAGDEALTKALSCTSCVPVKCEKTANVQGGLD